MIVTIADISTNLTIVWVATPMMETLMNWKPFVVTATTPKVQTVAETAYGRNSKWIKNQSLKS